MMIKLCPASIRRGFSFSRTMNPTHPSTPPAALPAAEPPSPRAPHPDADRRERHRLKRLALWRYILAFPRSVWLNFSLLPFSQARRLPLLVSHRTKLLNLSGRIELHPSALRVGLVKIGFNTCQQTDFRHHRTLLNLRGTLHIYGECAIGAGSSIDVSPSGTLSLGHHFNLGPSSLIVCNHSIAFGPHVQTSWCCTLMDTDQHPLFDSQGRHCNPDRPIQVADHVWLGCHVVLLKGTTLPPHTTVGAMSCVHGTFLEPHTVIAGNPAAVVRHGVTRQW